MGERGGDVRHQGGWGRAGLGLPARGDALMVMVREGGNAQAGGLREGSGGGCRPARGGGARPARLKSRRAHASNGGTAPGPEQAVAPEGWGLGSRSASGAHAREGRCCRPPTQLHGAVKTAGRIHTCNLVGPIYGALPNLRRRADSCESGPLGWWSPAQQTIQQTLLYSKHAARPRQRGHCRGSV